MHRSRDSRVRLRAALPARRPACVLGAPADPGALFADAPRIYVATRDEHGFATVDVVDGTIGDAVAARTPLPIPAPDWGGHGDGAFALAAAMIEDATGHPPRLATTNAFVEDVLDHLPHAGFAISSSEICAWLLMRAIERDAARQL
jgi:hypothetical protein